MKNPMNDLERAYVFAITRPEGNPELFRLLRESDLIFLMPFHPELEGTMGVGQGDPLPKFSLWKSEQGTRIPLFTSMERAHEALKKIGARDNDYALAEMNGKQLFDLISCQENPIVINPACETSATFMDLRAVKKLADGSILETAKEGAQQQGQVEIVQPADYPTSFLQPLFRFLKERPEVKAAWLFRATAYTGANKTSYVFVLQATGELNQLSQAFGLVANTACPPNTKFGVTFRDPNNAELMKITSKHAPFYAASGFKNR